MTNIENEEQLAFQRRSRATVGELVEAVAYAQRMVHCYFPNAHLLVSTDDIGRAASCGVYDCEVRMNHLHNFNWTAQPSPQLLGERIVYAPRKMDADVLLLSKLDAWISAIQHCARVHPGFTERIGMSFHRSNGNGRITQTATLKRK